MKFTTNIRIDIALIPTFILLVLSGVGIHVTDEITRHAAWHAWAVTHVVAATAFLTLGIFHIKGHLAWFRSLTRILKKKSKPNIILSLLFIIETATGIILLAFTDGGNTHLGLWHWWLGLIMTGFSIAHIIKRWKSLELGYAKLKK